MLRLRRCILTHLLSSPPASPISSLHRLLSTTAPVAPTPASPGFAVEEYLVSTCGLTRAQAIKASAKLSHLKSPAKPDAVLAFLAGLGLSAADIATLVARDPRFLCAGVETTLAPVVAGLTGLGLSNAETARLVLLAPDNFRVRSVVSKIDYYLLLFGSVGNLLRALKYATGLLDYHLERAVKPNVKLLTECGLGACDIAKLFVYKRRMLNAKPGCVQAMVARAKGIGVPRGSGMFRHALHAVADLSEEEIAARVEQLKKTLRWSDAEVRVAVCKWPQVLSWSKDMLQRKAEFLTAMVGLEPTYIAHRPAMLGFSLEGRLKPRYYVMRFLKENGLLNHDRDYYYMVVASQKLFEERFICPHKQAAPHLAEDYAATCIGEVPARFRFT
ncbi:hypothetical protein D1007_31008 [Hordeum vulgare]|nr:hypothetical protein D1007_31008 [Hordeum vulgare]